MSFDIKAPLDTAELRGVSFDYAVTLSILGGA
jgi:hypothetical protein